MDAALRVQAEAILDSLPSSLEKPAGTGKTEIVAALAKVAEDRGKRVLILTHTHAGVEAIRSRLRQFEVTHRAVHVDTITGWAYDLVHSYPVLSGLEVPEEPNWDLSDKYIEGATAVVQADALRKMHAARFDYFIVDEYQDCDHLKHELVLSISAAIPATCVLGDPLQGIFDWAGPLVDWDDQVLPSFPAFETDHVPHRWIGHNEDLGSWLLEIRPLVLNKGHIDVSNIGIQGVDWAPPSREALQAKALGAWPAGESVLVLGQWAKDTDQFARDLVGTYSVMENVQGTFMAKYLALFDQGQPEYFALIVARLAKECFTGLAGLDKPVLEKLHAQATVGHLTREGLGGVLNALDVLLAKPTLAQVVLTMIAIESTPSIRLFRREAWGDVRRAIEASIQSGDPTAVSLARVRDALRHGGRRTAGRVLSKTVLVKGLQYDHVIVADAALLTSGRNIYVAMTRARKSLTIFSANPVIHLK